MTELLRPHAEQTFADELAALERAQVFVDRVVPLSWPDDPPVGHFAETADDADGSLGKQTLTWAHADGVATLRLQGGLARALLPNPIPAGARWQEIDRPEDIAHWQAS